MTAKEAHDIIKKQYPNMTSIECLEFADFFAFALVETGRENESIATAYNTVDKNTSALSVFNPIEDFDSYFAAKSIDLEELI